ncbi:hypothetical protein F442_20794 [Phytophthora nicotianae P10297]|uniref:Myb-like domain-containing protein n=3 Tax=Phytophthora nicotianae TaxID=4792 RepID=W2PJ99_PHYN3|nr:hypothetical protein PPTG_18276 [Phytophthora nicotianae INRA-310]ETL79179.1 hypothetical protein L917_20123 [Phytophthora nicotianae]ETN00105.1 hypothetical protein PPTG_18276 [Phytophthora nicotianae INRA-310]ETP30151.1 hypothetical protein F442_20794 [Phytophthora nicotianae P10297]
MSDVAQILGLAGPKSGANGAAASDLDQLKPSGASPSVRGKSSGNASKQKKLTGMQREVLELLESSHRASHALYQGFGKTSLKQKWQERKKSPAVKWIRKSFRNPARAALAGENGEEGLTLTHWGKAHLEQPDYVFARFNVKSEVTSYTDKEYEAALAHHQDPMMKWSKEEMDLLMKLCQRFDLRWVVISDKYNSNPIAKGAPRSVEDIKYCYYEVTRLLAEYRDKKELEKKVSAATPAASASTPVSPAATGVTTPVATITETASTSSTPIPATPTSSTSEHYKFNIAYEKQRKRQLDLAFSRTVEEENEIRRLNDELRGVEQQLKKVAVRADLKKKKELADVPYEIKRTLPTGVILRSSLLALPQQKHALSAKLLKKLQLLLDEMGVPARPMPTKPVCETFDKLRQDAVGLLSLRKHLKSKQNEVQALRERYHALTGQEYKPITTPVTMSERPGDAALADGSNSATSAANYTLTGAKCCCSTDRLILLIVSCSCGYRQDVKALGEGHPRRQATQLKRSSWSSGQTQQESSPLIL